MGERRKDGRGREVLRQDGGEIEEGGRYPSSPTSSILHL